MKGYRVSRRIRDASEVKVPAFPAAHEVRGWKVELGRAVQEASGWPNDRPLIWSNQASKDSVTWAELAKFPP